MTDWLSSIQALPPNRLGVQHKPETDRYARARAKLRYVVRESTVLGTQDEDVAVVVAMWCPSGHGRGPGFYTCFRVYVDQQGEAVYASMFCFYDGTDSSHGFRSLEAALEYARSQGFTQGDEDENSNRA